MKNYVVLCKAKDSGTISMFPGLTYNQANKLIGKLKKEGASNLQLRKQTIGASSVLVG